MYKIELHAHTKKVSGCGKLYPEELIKAYADVGYSAVTVTNHFTNEFFANGSKDELDRYIEAYEECDSAGKKYGVKIYKGAEFRFSHCDQDFLIYGVDIGILEKMMGCFDMTFKEFHEFTRSEDCLFIQAHPFRHGNLIIPVKELDGIEIYNMHAGQNSHNACAELLQKERNIPYATSGSDCHEYNSVGRGGIISETLPADEKELCELIRSGKFELIHNEGFNYENIVKG